MKNIPNTYAEAKAMGYKDGDLVLTKGYVSRKSIIDNLPVEEAGSSRRGQLYVKLPNWRSTRYCFRQYLIAPKEV